MSDAWTFKEILDELDRYDETMELAPGIVLEVAQILVVVADLVGDVQKPSEVRNRLLKLAGATPETGA